MTGRQYSAGKLFYVQRIANVWPTYGGGDKQTTRSDKSPRSGSLIKIPELLPFSDVIVAERKHVKTGASSCWQRLLPRHGFTVVELCDVTSCQDDDDDDDDDDYRNERAIMSTSL